FSTDVSDASGTGYFDVKNRKWSKEILDAFGISEELLPQVYESSQAVGKITGETAEQTGLSMNTVVVAGAGDQAAAAVGNGVIKPGCTSISLGTSGVVFTAVDNPVYDKEARTHTFCHAVENMWHVMGVTQGCGLSVNWFRKNFASDYSYAELDEKAESITSDGIIYLPYLMGERTPHLDPNCRGSFTGISVNHNRFNFYRAVLEGVCFSLKDCCEVICESGIDLNTVKVGGGGAKSKLWLQILADTITKNLYTSKCVESGALGVAILASVGCGCYSSVTEAAEKMTDNELTETEYNPEKSDYYNSIYKVYGNLYRAIKSASL
ncbi:MAG: xylulokinase, partial [Acutalibacteraceae bacterium]